MTCIALVLPVIASNGFCLNKACWLLHWSTVNKMNNESNSEHEMTSILFQNNLLYLECMVLGIPLWSVSSSCGTHGRLWEKNRTIQLKINLNYIQKVVDIFLFGKYTIFWCSDLSLFCDSHHSSVMSYRCLIGPMLVMKNCLFKWKAESCTVMGLAWEYRKTVSV